MRWTLLLAMCLSSAAVFAFSTQSASTTLLAPPLSLQHVLHKRLVRRAKTAQNFGLARLKLSEHLSSNTTSASGTFYTSAYSDDSLMDYSTTVFKWTTSTGRADVTIDTRQAEQIIDGFGGALTDAPAILLMNLKRNDETAYRKVMNVLFNPTSGQRMIRVPMGSCDFSIKLWTYQDKRTDDFDLGPAKEHQIPVLRDAVRINPYLHIMLSPWSPPKWMKTIDNLAGGQLNMTYLDDLAEYYAKAAVAFSHAGVGPSHMTIQNEPDYWGEYPSMRMDSLTQSKVASAIRKALDKKRLVHVKIIAHDNNYGRWSSALDVLNLDKNRSVDGIGFHCYRGGVSQVDDLRNAAKRDGIETEIHMTECSAAEASQTRYNAMQWWLGSLFFPIIEKGARSVCLFNLALTSSFGPRLPTAYCTDCRASVTIDGIDVSINSQALVIGHFSAATSDFHAAGGGYSRRVSTELSGHQDCIKGIQAFAAPLNGVHLSSSPRQRVGLVIQSDCGAAIEDVSFDVNGRTFYITVRPGLTTLVFPISS